MISVQQLGDCLVAVGVDRSPRHRKRHGDRPVHVDRDGYARIWRDGRQRLAHRVVAAWAFGGLADEAVVHHTCGRRACVNPKHLKPMERGAHVRLHAEQRRRTATPGSP